MRVQPFPFGALPALSRGDLQARAAVRARVLASCDVTRMPEAWTAVFGTSLDATSREARVRPAAIGTPGDVGVLLAPSNEDRRHAVLVELEGALAAAAVALALRGKAPVVHDTTQVPSARVVGAAAAVVLAVVRRMARVPLKIVAAGPAHVLAADLHRTAQALATWPHALELERVRYELRLTTTLTLLDEPLEPRAFLASTTPLTVPVVIARFAMTPAELGVLESGDALMIPGLEHTKDAWLVTPASEHARRVSLEAGTVTDRGEADTLPWDETTEERPMNEGFAESLGDLPVVVRVEVGSVELPARRWAELAEGDTLTLGQRVGAPVTLRVSGVEVARGELVQIEGEIGVRITQRVDANLDR